MNALMEKTDAADGILARREQLWMLKDARLEATPARGWQSFFLDLWNAVEREGKPEIAEIAGEPDAESLEITDGFSVLRLDRAFCAAVLGAARELDAEDGSVRVRDGMVSLVTNRCARVIAVVDEITLPNPSWLDVAVCALQWAAWQGASPERMREALLSCCMGNGRLREVGRVAGIRFLDGHAFRSQDDVRRALRWMPGPAFVVLGGNFVVLDSRLEELMISGDCTLIHLMSLPRAQRSVLRRSMDVYAVSSMKSALAKALKISDGETAVVCFPAVGCAEVEALRLGAEWARTVSEA